MPGTVARVNFASPGRWLPRPRYAPEHPVVASGAAAGSGSWWRGAAETVLIEELGTHCCPLSQPKSRGGRCCPDAPRWPVPPGCGVWDWLRPMFPAATAVLLPAGAEFEPSLFKGIPDGVRVTVRAAFYTSSPLWRVPALYLRCPARLLDCEAACDRVAPGGVVQVSSLSSTDECERLRATTDAIRATGRSVRLCWEGSWPPPRDVDAVCASLCYLAALCSSLRKKKEWKRDQACLADTLYIDAACTCEGVRSVVDALDSVAWPRLAKVVLFCSARAPARAWTAVAWAVAQRGVRKLRVRFGSGTIPRRVLAGPLATRHAQGLPPLLVELHCDGAHVPWLVRQPAVALQALVLSAAAKPSLLHALAAPTGPACLRFLELTAPPSRRRPTSAVFRAQPRLVHVCWPKSQRRPDRTARSAKRRRKT